MPRRSKRLSNKKMSTEKDEITPDASGESDCDKTIIDAEEFSVEDLKNEILSLKMKLREIANTPPEPAKPPTDCHLPALTSPNTSTYCAAMTSYKDMPEKNPTLPVSNLQSYTADTREYYKPCQTNLAYKTSLPLNSAQSFPPTTTPLPFSTTQTYLPRTYFQCSLPQTFMPAATASYSAAHLTRTTSSNFAPTSLDLLQQRSTQIYTAAQSHSAPVSSPYLPHNPICAPVNMNDFQSGCDTRQLRKLHDLPQFSSLPEQWPMFIVAFRETTNNYNYSNLENLIRLQKALKGDARARVESFLIHPDSVNQVVSTLEFHYGRPQILIRSQIAKVRALPEKRINEIVNFSTMVLNLSAFLINANATAHLCNPTLLDELVSKLPIQKREEWTKYSMTHLGPYPSVSEFSVWLQEAATYISLLFEADTYRNESNVLCATKTIDCTTVKT